MRQGRPGIRGSFVQVESRMSQTGANADEWVPATPGTEGVLALGLAHVIIADKLRPADAGGPRRRADRRLERGAERLHARAGRKDHRRVGARVERLAREFAEHASRGRDHRRRRRSAHTNGLFNALAVNALNALVGSVEQPGGMYFTPQLNISPPRKRRPRAADVSSLERSAADSLRRPSRRRCC